MLVFSILTAAVAPGVSLLTYLYLRDRYDSEPFHMVLRLFILGILVVVPIMVLQHGLKLWLGDDPFVSAFVMSAGVEEFLKWFVLYHVIYNHMEFDEPYDGIVYAASISLGFATMENVLYAIYMPSSIGTLFARALLPVSAHALFGIMMGYYLGRAKFKKKSGINIYIIISFILPFVLHGLYDWIILMAKHHWMWFIVPFMIILWIWGLRKMTLANARSPFRFIGRKGEIKL